MNQFRPEPKPALIKPIETPKHDSNSSASLVDVPQVEDVIEEEPEIVAEEPVTDSLPAVASRTEADIGTITERLLPTGILDIGDTNAPVTLLVFTEHHCEYCREFQTVHLPKLLKDYVLPGDVRLQIIAYPLNKYEHSELAAAGLLCAGLQQKGLPMHRLLAKDDATPKKIASHAATLELDTEVFNTCLDSQQVSHLLVQQKSIASSLDVHLVPTMFFNGEKSVGLPFYAGLRGKIDETLSER